MREWHMLIDSLIALFSKTLKEQMTHRRGSRAFAKNYKVRKAPGEGHLPFQKLGYPFALSPFCNEKT